MKKSNYVGIIFFIISLIFMLIITTSSPLYSVNTSPDSNVMFTIGKSFWHGLMPYKDLFDQRGPLIYFINSIAALISYKSFLGIYFIESILMFIDLFFIYKILNLKFDSFISITASLTSIPFIFNSKLLPYGNTPEEYALPLIFITIYMIICKGIEKWNDTNFYMMGIFLSFTFWIKYTSSITWIVLFIMTIIFFISRKKYKKTVKIIVLGLLGFMTITLPILLLYLLKGSLYSLFYVYFYLNFTSYHTTLVIFSKTFILLLITNLSFMIIISKSFQINKQQKLIINFITILTFAVQFYAASGSPYYYFETEYSFIIFPIIICYLYKLINLKYLYILVTLLVLPITFVTNKNYKLSNVFQPKNQYIDINQKTNIPIQKYFSTIIGKHKNAKILNYRNLDLGFYTYSGYIPKEKYFMWNNMNYKPMQNKQDKYLKSLKYNFVIMRYDIYPDEVNKQKLPYSVMQTIKKNYSILEKRTVLFEGKKETYVIYKIK